MTEIESEIKFKKSSQSTKDISLQINDLIDIFNKIQQMKYSLIEEYGKNITRDTAEKVMKNNLDIRKNFTDFNKNMKSVSAGETKNKKEFDLLNEYFNKNKKNTKESFSIILADIQKNKSLLYEKINTKYFRKHINDLDLNQKELNDLRKEIGLLLNKKKEK
jgi:hypothetical protein